jgi:hypothetical protein
VTRWTWWWFGCRGSRATREPQGDALERVADDAEPRDQVDRVDDILVDAMHLVARDPR